jgi:hypothetical protein
MRLPSAFLVVLLLAVSAQAGEHAGVLYTTPAGWTEKTEGASKVFTPPDVPAGDAVVAVITGAAPAGGEPAQVFNESIADAIRDVRVVGASPVTTSIRGAGTFLVQAHHVETADLGRHLRLHAMVIDGRKRVFAVVIVKPDTILPRYQAEIVALFESLSFVGGTPPH